MGVCPDDSHVSPSPDCEPCESPPLLTIWVEVVSKVARVYEPIGSYFDEANLHSNFDHHDLRRCLSVTVPTDKAPKWTSEPDGNLCNRGDHGGKVHTCYRTEDYNG